MICTKRKMRLVLRCVLAWLPLTVGAGLCLLWVGCTANDLWQDEKSAERMKELQQVQTVISPMEKDRVTPSPALKPTAVPESEPLILPKMATLYAQNTDLAGWLTIEGTVIDYPVMYTPEDEEYYLTRGFDKQPDKNGMLIIQKECDPLKPGSNIIIHGHNMKNGKMFGSLDAYEEESYWRKHPTIRFDTLYEQGEYVIVAVFLSQIYNRNEDVFKYYQFINADTQAEFDDFYSNILQLSLYDTGVDATFGDCFLTLSTCSYHTDNGRLVVVAKKVQEP